MIWIFGDSLASDYSEKDSWPQLLSSLKNEKIEVFGTGGTGPNYSFNLLIERLEHNIRDNDTVIFIISDQKRLQFPWLKSPGHSSIMFRLTEDELDLYIRGRHRYLLNHVEDAKTIAQTLGPMFLYENVKNITFLHLLSKNFKNIKFLVFTSFDLNNTISNYKNFNIKSTSVFDKLDFKDLCGDNFIYFEHPVFNIIGDNVGEFLNHMTIEQNRRFANLVVDLIDNNSIDSSWFREEEYEDVYEYPETNTIYKTNDGYKVVNNKNEIVSSVKDKKVIKQNASKSDKGKFVYD